MKKTALTTIIKAAVLIMSAAVSSASGSDFPTPEGLEVKVEFWEKIFSVYSTNEYVIHDNEYLDIIYEVVDFRSTPRISEAKKRDIIEKTKNKYIVILNKIGRLKDQPHKLTKEELAVYKKFGGADGWRRFKNAAGRLRAQGGISDRFSAGYDRSKRYMDRFRGIFRKHGLPEELAYLPHVESSFDVRAYSSCGAAGIWQFTRSTGKIYLTISGRVDQRLDPYLSADAAARLLKENYKALGEWPLAVTAYNHGAYGMMKAVRTVGSSNIVHIIARYKGESFGFASKNFYAEFLAARKVAMQHETVESTYAAANKDWYAFTWENFFVKKFPPVPPFKKFPPCEKFPIKMFPVK